MANMSLKKNEMPSQDPNVRNKNFKEVALGYTYETAVNEAQRCINCKNPACVQGCPVNIDIPSFIPYNSLTRIPFCVCGCVAFKGEFLTFFKTLTGSPADPFSLTRAGRFGRSGVISSSDRTSFSVSIV